MTRLETRLRDIPTPDTSEARERTVAEARAAVAAPSPAAQGRGGAARVLVALGTAAILVAVVVLTPPGRAASAWVGELVGIGEVGGSPTRDDRPMDASDAVVIDNGRAPDGSRYEWVAYRCDVDMGAEGVPGGFRGIGVSLEWPGSQGPGGGGNCAEVTGAPTAGAFTSHGVHVLPSQFKDAQRPDLVVAGSTGPRVHRVEILYTDRFGEKHELPVDFARVEGKLRELAHQSAPIGTFTAFIPGDVAARDELESRLDLRALYGTGELERGPLGRRERAQALEAFEACERHDTGSRASARCLEERFPPSPIEYVAYDEAGQEIERTSESLIAYTQPPPSADDAAGREQPGDERGSRPTSPGQSDPVVVLSGRAPDGALYGAYATFTEDGTPYGQCVSIWWPYVRDAGASGTCADALPPDNAFDPRHGERVAAKPFGYLGHTAAAATAHLFLSGYARPGVRRVQLRYRDRGGSWHDAPVDLAQMDGARLERMRADGPFGYFVAFVPRSVDRCQGGRPERCMALEVLAHGRGGEELSRVRWRSD